MTSTHAMRSHLLDNDPMGGAHASGPGWHYRRHLDGLRALAVVLVILFHADLAAFFGGFIGVDVFFVLSGFVVTGVLLRELNGGAGLSFARFYERRVRRLLPAALATILAIAATWTFVAAPLGLSRVRSDLAAAALYVSNWRFLAEASDYFGEDVAHSPALHLWSLSVEEQFYLLWPVLILAMFRLARGDRRRMLLGTGIALGAAIGWMLWLAHGDVLRSYYGTDARAYQLLLGSMLGVAATGNRLSSPDRSRLAGTIVALGLAGTVTVSVVLPALSPPLRGLLAAGFVGLVILGSELAAETAPVRWLAHPALRYLGRRSYAMYLWHWPIALVLQRETQIAGVTRATVILAASVAFAEVSHRLLEHPVRARRVLSGWRPSAAVALGVALSVSAGASTYLVLGSLAANRGIADWEFAATDARRARPCAPGAIERCRLVTGDGKKVLLLGDSHMAHLVPAFEQIARARGWELWESTKGSCPAAEVLTVRNGRPRPKCLESLEVAIQLAIDRRIDLVVIGGLYSQIVREDGRTLDTGTPAQAAALARGIGKVVRRLHAGGVPSFLVIEPIPRSAVEVPECLSLARSASDCDFADAFDTRAIETELRALPSKLPAIDLRVLDLDPAVCPDPAACPAVENGLVTRRDRGHLTASYSRTIWRRIVAVAGNALGSPPDDSSPAAR